MKGLIVLGILVLLVVGAVQWVGASFRQHDFAEKLHDVASQVDKDNQEEIKRQVVAEGGKLHLKVAPSDVHIRYEPTPDLSYAQRFVSKIGSFQNHRATITVDYTQPVLVLSLKRHAEGTALIESVGQPKRAQPMPEP
jgi:hypothetical protein